MTEHLKNLHVELAARLAQVEGGSEDGMFLSDMLAATNMLTVRIANYEREKEARQERLKAMQRGRPLSGSGRSFEDMGRKDK